jgi:hypothetical protein
MLDIGMAAFSLFFMQNESFLQYQQMLEKKHGKSNCQTLFGMSKIPTDSHIRKMLDGTSPSYFDDMFPETLRTLEQEKALGSFHRFGDRLLIALDGTEYFNSYDIHCENCSHRERSNGKTEYFHTFLSATVVAPGRRYVIPLQPEFIVPQDGHSKQDCESFAARRWLQKHGSTYQPYKPIYLGDDLFSKHPICQAIRNVDGNFIFTCKPDSHKTIEEYLQGATFSEYTETHSVPGRGKRTHHYRWICNIPIRDSHDALEVNWFDITISDENGKRTYYNSFVTDISIDESNVVELSACGRSRWKIENEGFNVLKNNGYNLEHNYGHGKQTLASVLVVLNLIAFAFHTVCELVEEIWQQARESWYVRRRFFGHLWTMASFLVFSTWDELLQALIGSPSGRRPRRLAPSG